MSDATDTGDELLPGPSTPPDPDHPRVRAALDELRALISSHYPATAYRDRR